MVSLDIRLAPIYRLATAELTGMVPLFLISELNVMGCPGKINGGFELLLIVTGETVSGTGTVRQKSSIENPSPNGN
jgi:hypothetical protein